MENSKIRLGIVGYGNLGKAVELNIGKNPDMEIVAIVSRRPFDNPSYPVYDFSQIEKLLGKVDVMIMCGGSSVDLPIQTPMVLKKFCTVDSFDTHAKIPEYFKMLDGIAKASNTLGAVSIGWDPGLFSMARAMFSSFLPDGKEYTFWGKGVSQGHSDAIRRIDGVVNAVQYTIPKEDAIAKVRAGKMPTLSVKDRHLRECFVVAKEGWDRTEIERQIKTMPNYFADYDTVVHFIDEGEFQTNHSKISHGGFVLRSGETDVGAGHLLELSIKLDSNPQFTSSVLLAYARAVNRMHKEGRRGAVTVLDVPLGYLSQESMEKLREKLL